MKRTLTVAGLVLSLCLTGALAAENFFPKTADMPAFTDLSPTGVPSGAWYDYASIQTTVEAGLMKGVSATAFAPDGSITLAEVATIAARINETTTGYAIPKQEAGQPWYAPALAVMEHIGISLGSDPTAKATRNDFVRILSAVLPDEMLVPINTITALPDTKDVDVLRFYNAGILQGKNAYGTFGGTDNLRRSDSAAMVARIINPDLRKVFTPAYSPSLLFSSGGISSNSLFTQSLYRQVPLSTWSADSRTALCALAGLSPDTVMVTFDGLPAVTAQEFLPLLVEAVATTEATMAEDRNGGSFWETSWTSATGIARDAATQAKWMAVDICARAAILAENPNLANPPCCEALEKFQASRHATLSDAAKVLDPKAVYVAYQSKA